MCRVTIFRTSDWRSSYSNADSTSVRSWPPLPKYFLNHHPWIILPVSELLTLSWCTPIENKFSVLHPIGSALITKAQITELSPKPVHPGLYPHSIFPDHKLFILSYPLCQVLSSHEIVLPNKIYLLMVYLTILSVSQYIYNEECGSTKVWLNSRFYPGTWPEESYKIP